MKLFVILLILSNMLSCRKSSIAGGDQDSKVSTVSIGKFTPAQDQPSWQTMDLEIYKVANDTSESLYDEKSVNLESFATTENQEYSKIDMRLPYATYRFNLIYRDTFGEVVYQSCEKDRDGNQILPSVIDQPEEPVEVLICDMSDAPVASTDEGSSVSIETQILASEQSLANAGVIAAQGFNQNCASCHGPDGGSLLKIDVEKFSGTDAYEYRTRGLSEVINKTMPKNNPEFDGREAFIKALECLEVQSKSKCETE